MVRFVVRAAVVHQDKLIPSCKILDLQWCEKLYLMVIRSFAFLILLGIERNLRMLSTSITMSDFDPSPRSSKRRKPAANVTDSAKPDKSPSSLRSISRTARAISQPLFKPINRDDGVSLGDTSPVVRYSTYKPREDDQGRPELVTGKAIVQDRGSSESADELAQSEVTVTPTKSERTAPRRKIKTPKAVGQVGRIGDADQKSDSSPIRTRTSGRGRKQPRRYSSNWEDSSKPTLPKGILTPSKKSNKGPRKSVVFEQNGSEVMDDLGFKDVDQTAQERTPRSSRKSNPKFSDEAQGQLVNPTLQGVTGEDEAEEGFVEDMTVPEPPENAVSLLMKPTSANKDSRLDVAKSIVLSRLTGESRTPLINLEVEYNKLHSLLLATIKAGEGNSILLLGSRGSGKTCLVESAIAELRIENGADFHVVRLDGFLQTDDKLALREIWRQLGREMQIQEDETAQISSYADTMASLLHLLSHPEEWAETADAHAATRTTKSVIFVLDEFDLFTTHPRQTLLYNLFDIAQARKAPIAVVGCSARIDVGDHLEKRVKSRFSHRWIHLSQAKSFPAFQDIAKAGLMLRAEDIHDLGHDFPKMRSDWNAYIEVGASRQWKNRG